MDDTHDPRTSHPEFADEQRDEERPESELWWDGYLSSVRDGERLSSERSRNNGRRVMDWGSYILGAASVLVSVFVGYAMGRGASEKESHDEKPKGLND